MQNKHFGFKVSLLVVSLCLVCVVASASFAATPTERQRMILKLAQKEGSKIGWPETIQAIVIQETRAGSYGHTPCGIVGDRNARAGNRSYGVMQVRLETAKDVLRRYPHLGEFQTDKHLLAALLTDDLFNIRVGAHYFAMMQERFGDWRKAVIAYNAGPSNARINRDPNRYADKVRDIIVNDIRGARSSQ